MRRDDRADVPTIEDCTAGTGGKIPLPGKECGTNRGMGGNDRGIFRGSGVHQIRMIEEQRIELLGRTHRRGGVIGALSGKCHGETNRPIKLPCIKVIDVKVTCERSSDRSLAAGSGTVHRDQGALYSHRFA